MHRLLGRYSDDALALLRMVAGFLFLCHGAQKFGLTEDAFVMPAGRALVAGVIELVGGGLMMVGLLTSSVAFVASGLMACAYVIVHAPQGFLPLLNKGEPAVLFCFIWLYVSTRSPGKFALDNLFMHRRRNLDDSHRLPRAS